MLREAAMRAFARGGFAGASVESIAEAAGFSGGAFYANYRSKQDILVDIMRRLQTAESEQWQQVIGTDRSTDEIIDELAERAERFARRQDWLLTKVELDLRAARNEEFRREYDACRAELRQQALTMLEGLYTREGKRPPPNAPVLADAWLAFSTGIGLCYIAENDPASREVLRKTVFIPFLRGLLVQGDPPGPQQT